MRATNREIGKELGQAKLIENWLTELLTDASEKEEEKLDKMLTKISAIRETLYQTLSNRGARYARKMGTEHLHITARLCKGF